jgi:membrane associated rhomboid family serine protease
MKRVIVNSDLLEQPEQKPLYPYIIVINVAVFLNWHFSGHIIFMEKNFLVSWDSLGEGRYWTLLTSVFSHIMFWHLFVNMFVLQSFGSIIEKILGRTRFVVFYLVAGIISSLCHCFVSKFLLDTPELPALGASGAIAGLVLIFALVYPKAKILLFAIIPIPALLGALVFIALDIWGVIAQAKGGGLPIGHGAHLGGAFTGIVFYFFCLRSKLKNKI